MDTPSPFAGFVPVCPDMKPPLEIIRDWFTALDPLTKEGLDIHSLMSLDEYAGLKGEAAFISWIAPSVPLSPGRHADRALKICTILQIAFQTFEPGGEAFEYRCERKDDGSFETGTVARDRWMVAIDSWEALRSTTLSDSSIMEWKRAQATA